MHLSGSPGLFNAVVLPLYECAREACFYSVFSGDFGLDFKQSSFNYG